MTSEVAVVVNWSDACGQEGPIREDEFCRLKEIVSCGLLVREDEELITLAQDYNPDDKCYREILHIPKVNINKIRKLKYKW